jgi:hypothetical protein
LDVSDSGVPPLAGAAFLSPAGIRITRLSLPKNNNLCKNAKKRLTFAPEYAIIKLFPVNPVITSGASCRVLSHERSKEYGTY